MKIKTELNRVVVTLDKPANQIFVYPKRRNTSQPG